MDLKSLIKKIPFIKNSLKKLYLNNKSAEFEKISRNTRVDPKLVVFEAYQGRNYGCSPKAIYKYMLSAPEFSDYSYVWVFRDLNAHGEFPPNTRTVKFESKDAFLAYAQAGMWITNSRLRDFYVPKKNQKYVQCWHGTPFKKIGCDVKAAGNATSTVQEIYDDYTNEAKRISCFVSPSDFTTSRLISAFNLETLGKENCIIQQGYPRNDSLFNTDSKSVENFKNRLSIPKNKKVILYCPTFRDSQYSSGGYTLKPAIDFDSLKRNCGDDFVVLFRAHYFIANSFDFEKYSGYVVNVSDYDDINDLYLISDILITDYSSVFFDYANLRRPMLFYLYDFEEYKNNMRDFYFGTAMLPGPVVQSQDRLENELLKILDDLRQGGNGLFRYELALNAFNKKFNPLEDGHSAERTVKEIFSRFYAGQN